MLDDADRDAAFGDLAHDTLHRLIGLPLDAGHRLIEKQALGVTHQRTRNPDQLLLAVRQIGHEIVGDLGQPNLGQNTLCLLAGCAIVGFQSSGSEENVERGFLPDSWSVPISRLSITGSDGNSRTCCHVRPRPPRTR